MGMVCTFRRLPEVDLARLHAQPELIGAYLGGHSKLEGFGPHVDLDVDKAWHGIHFLLTGTAWEGEAPLDFVVTGGEPIGQQDVGYGPARGLSRAEVGALADALAPLSEDVLGARFDPEAMLATDIYPSIWDRDPADDDTRGYLLHYYATLRRFVSDAARAGEALIMFLS
jgi:hypothetical protein